MAARKESRKGWIVDFVFAHADGSKERVRKRSPVQTRRGAEEYERQIRVEMLNPRAKQKDAPALRDYVVTFMRLHGSGLKPSTQQGYRLTMARHLIPRFGDKRIDAIDTRCFATLSADLREAGLSPKTVINACGILAKVLQHAVDMGDLEAVPRWKRPKVPPQPFHYLQADELAHLLGELSRKDRELYVACLLACDAGLRIGEIKALRWTDVFFPGSRINVSRSAWFEHEGTPKSGKARTVDMTHRLREALVAHRHLASAYVLHRNGKPWTKEVERWAGERMYRLAGMPKPCSPWHCLRHTFASHLVMRGAPIKAVQELLGHATIEMTMRYAHMAPAVRRDAVALLDRPWHLCGTSSEDSRNNEQLQAVNV